MLQNNVKINLQPYKQNNKQMCCDTFWLFMVFEVGINELLTHKAVNKYAFRKMPHT